MDMRQMFEFARKSAAMQPALIMALALLYAWRGDIGTTELLLAAILAEMIYTRERT